MNRKICVIGAGVIGLSSAIRIQERFPQCNVTIIADNFSPDTTSDGAGALLGVFAVGDTDFNLIEKWAKDTKYYLESVALSPESAEARVQFVSGYNLGDGEYIKMLCSDLQYGFRDLTKAEMQYFPTSSWGQYFTAIQVDCTSYLPWLTKRFLDNGGVIIKNKINCLSELYEDYHIIVNCSGLRASQLVGDTDVIPARGESIRVIAPWIKHFYLKDTTDSITYIIPGSKNVTLGGTYQKGNWNTDSNKLDSKALWQRCVDLVPSLKHAKVDYHWVGLRPARRQIRLEMEQVTSKNCLIIHNYGHGGSGVTLHWGCAGTVTDLVAEALQNPIQYSKL